MNDLVKSNEKLMTTKEVAKALGIKKVDTILNNAKKVFT